MHKIEYINKMRSLYSTLDASANFIVAHKGSLIESRYVRRDPTTISAYLSSHNGCTMGCKFCWLTATGQTKFNHSNITNYNDQLIRILEHAKDKDSEEDKTKIRLNINFMARGEPLANKTVINDYPALSKSLQDIVRSYGYLCTKINLSTIMPHTVKEELATYFSAADLLPNIYYSMYSTNPAFRNKWIPKAQPYDRALAILKNYQMTTDSPITIHFAVIKGENDNLQDVLEMAKVIKDKDFSLLKFNIIQYNPPSNSKYISADTESIDEIFNILSSVAKDVEITTKRSRIVPRVGEDVKASCGMFISDIDTKN